MIPKTKVSETCLRGIFFKQGHINADTAESIDIHHGVSSIMLKRLHRIWGGWESGLIRISLGGTSLVVQWLRLHTPNARGSSPIPGQGTRSRMPQLRPSAAK